MLRNRPRVNGLNETTDSFFWDPPWSARDRTRFALVLLPSGFPRKYQLIIRGIRALRKLETDLAVRRSDGIWSVSRRAISRDGNCTTGWRHRHIERGSNNRRSDEKTASIRMVLGAANPSANHGLASARDFVPPKKLPKRGVQCACDTTQIPDSRGSDILDLTFIWDHEPVILNRCFRSLSSGPAPRRLP